MHIPDGYLSPQTYAPLYGAWALFCAVALKKLKKQLSTKQVPYLAMAAAFSFLVMMFNIPVPGGTTGHTVGAGIIAIIMGPWTAVVAVSVVLMVQALVFGDGGITSLGANCFNMAVAMPFASYWTFKTVSGRSDNIHRLLIAAFLAGYVGLTLSAALTGLEFGIQPAIAKGLDGRPLYAPYPLSIALPAMVIEHLFLFSIIEGMVTLLIFRYFYKHEPDLIHRSSRNGDRHG